MPTPMMAIARMPALTLVALCLAACAQQGAGTDHVALAAPQGHGIGQPGGAVTGTAAGALAGRELARRLTDEDGQLAADAEARALRDGASATWANAASGRRGTVDPIRTYESSSGATCRDYAHTVLGDGEAETARGTACRQADGSWRPLG